MLQNQSPVRFRSICANFKEAKHEEDTDRYARGGVDASDDERQLIDKLRAFLQDKRYIQIFQVYVSMLKTNWLMTLEGAYNDISICINVKFC